MMRRYVPMSLAGGAFGLTVLLLISLVSLESTHLPGPVMRWGGWGSWAEVGLENQEAILFLLARLVTDGVQYAICGATLGVFSLSLWDKLDGNLKSKIIRVMLFLRPYVASSAVACFIGVFALGCVSASIKGFLYFGADGNNLPRFMSYGIIIRIICEQLRNHRNANLLRHPKELILVSVLSISFAVMFISEDYPGLMLYGQQ